MAFESFRLQDRRSPRTLRRIAFALVAVFHGVLICAGVAYSYWHVDELTPPTLRVTFMTAMPPPPPPPPPPAGGGARPKKVALKPKTPEPVVVPKPTDIVQPPEKTKPIKREFRKHEDEYVEDDDKKPGTGPGKGVGKGSIDGDDDGEDDGVVGGQKGGQKGGQIGGVIGASGETHVAPKILAPGIGALQRQGCADPPFPPSLRRAGVDYLVVAKVCVARSGTVESVTLLKKEDSLLDNGVIAAEKACHYKPLVIGATTVPFCYMANYQFKGQ
jgi:protein TonB